ncbi:glycosyltransferase [Actinomadura formosensis]|uniref:glycosyltransferase n=1 Tax=Actinomadura formosensis TaxID=60706 RepID=UPI000A5E2F47|nr:glycosyltransferase [Actinomadura formosensis]
MKALVLAGVAPSTIFSHVPLATALRNAGHQVMVTASNEEMIQTIVDVGLPAVRVTDPDVSLQQILAAGGKPVHVPTDPVERERMSGGWYARLEAATLDALLAFAEDWRPDVVIGGMASYAAPLLATRLGIPYVRHAWDIHDPHLMDLGATDDLREQLTELGLDRIPDPDMLIDITPPSLRPQGAAPAQMMRWIPGNSQCRLEPWMYTRGAGTRIGVTIGTGVANYNQYDFLQGLVENITALDAEVVVPVTEDAAPALRERLKDVRAGWIPLDVLAPTCDVLVHQTGGSTMMTALSFGVPQILIPDPAMHRVNEMARRLVESGAALALSPQEATSEAVAKTCQKIISDPGYAEAAAGLAGEIAAQPLPSEVARRVERLVCGASAGRRD